MGCVKKPFLEELVLKLLKSQLLGAYTLRLNALYYKLVLAAGRIDIDLSETDDLKPVFRLEFQTPVRAPEHRSSQDSGLVFEGKIKMPRGVSLEIGYFTLNPDFGKGIL